MRVPAGTFKIVPVVLPSHRVLWLDAGAALVGSDVWQDYGATPFMPRMGSAMQMRPVRKRWNDHESKKQACVTFFSLPARAYAPRGVHHTCRQAL